MKQIRIFLALFVVVLLAASFLKTTQTQAVELGSFVRILSPNGGEILSTGQTYPITWEKSLDIDFVTLSYSLAGGNQQIISGTLPNTNSYVWWVPGSIGGSLPAQITITGYDIGSTTVVSDSSDNYFTIIDNSPLPTVSPIPPRCRPTICRPGVKCPVRFDCANSTF